MRKMVLGLSMILLAGVLSGCANGKDAEPTTPTKSPAVETPSAATPTEKEPTPAEEQEQNSKTDAQTSVGCATKEELVGHYLKWLAGELTNEEILKYYDQDVFLAYWLTEDYYDIAPTMEEAYRVAENPEQQPENFKELVKKISETSEEEQQKNIESMESMRGYSLQDKEVNEEYFWNSKAGYWKYKIPVEDEEVSSIGIVFAEKNGRFYWCVIYRTM